ncbi:MAG: hypothetical protein K6U80_16015 [Firmicutes bacterium]|nr:hypothetical protein [Bacillota bacterium]
MRKSDYPGELAFFSAIAGAVAAPVKLLVHHAFMWAGLTTGFYDELNSRLIHGHYQQKGFADMIFVEFGDIAIGAFFGFILGFWLRASRLKYHWGIGLSAGFGIWFLTMSFGNLTRIIKPEMTSPWELFAHLLAMLTFGILFVLATRFWKPLKRRIDSVPTCEANWRRK